MKRNQKTRRANTLFTLAALLVVLMSNVFMARSQTNELPDTVWTKFTYPYAINAVKFTPDGRYLASGGDDGVPRLWDAETGELVFEFPSFATGIKDLDISNDFIAFTTPGANGTRVYNLESKDLLVSLIGSLTVTFSNDGKYLVTSKGIPTGSGISIYETTNWKLIKSINTQKISNDLKVSIDNKYLVRSGNWGDISTEDKEGSIEIFTFPDLQYIGYLAKKDYLDCNNLNFSQENLHLAGAFSSEPNKIWNTSDWSLKSEIGNGTDSRAIEFSPDSKYVVFQKGYFGNRHVQIWENNILNYEYPKSSLVSSISISPDMRYIAVSNASGIIVYNAKWNPTSVAEGSIQILEPEIFPNPNDGKAIIRFNLIKNADVSVDIYDINSRLISNLYKGELNQGIQSFEWLAKVPNGIYFAKISSGKSVSSIKIIVER